MIRPRARMAVSRAGLVLFAAAGLCATGCSLGDGGVDVAPAGAVDGSTVAPSPPSTSALTSTTSTTTTTTSTSTTTTSTTSTSTTTTTAAPPGATYATQEFARYGSAGGVVLHLPARRVEMIGFHEAGHDGSRQQELLDGVVPSVVMDSRGRNTGSRTAADVVVAPDEEIRSPVTGTVIRGGTYVLYCDYSDDFVVIEPDGEPGWEVKMFHFDGLRLRVGDRVEAVTVVASRATVLLFESQVDEYTAAPHNPHVHIEVIDPSIPDIPTPGSGC
ncbi:MAG: hypothetical protein R2695_07805 [Acidimicrobiales bacterium]